MVNSASTEKPTRWQQIEQIWKDYVLEYGILAIVFFIVLGFWVFGDNLLNMLDNRLGYVTNVFTELLSIVITVFVLDRLNARRQDKQELTRLKALLGSNDAVVTKIAIAELRAKGWLYDGSLKGAHLWSANLEGANLNNANLEGAKLYNVSLQGAKLYNADLVGAELWQAKLASAKLYNADLEGAELWKAKLEGVDLSGANVKGTNLYGVICDENTILPNGQYWTEDVDWSEFGAVEINSFDE